MKSWILSLWLLLSVASQGTEFRHIGDYLLHTQLKITGSNVTPIPIKPLAFKVYTDGVTVRINLADDEKEAYATFEIYRSDGISLQRSESGAVEVIPGIQASTNQGGILRHLRLTQESFTLTTFPGVSDQTVVTYAVAATSKEQEASAKKP